MGRTRFVVDIPLQKMRVSPDAHISSRLQMEHPYVLLTLQLGVEQQVGEVELRDAVNAWQYGYVPSDYS